MKQKQIASSRRQAKSRSRQLQKRLDARTKKLVAANRQLQRCLTQRKLAAAAFAKSGKHDKESLAESLQLQKRLRQLTHRVLAMQEIERKKMGYELRDEIAQTLLGINVRLLSLKQLARNNVSGFKNEIASTQQLVLRSARSVRRAAREF